MTEESAGISLSLVCSDGLFLSLLSLLWLLLLLLLFSSSLSMSLSLSLFEALDSKCFLGGSTSCFVAANSACLPGWTAYFRILTV